MAFRRYPRAINKSDKHEITWSLLSTNMSTNQAIVLSSTVDVGAKSASTEVAVGSHVKWIYIEFNLSNQDATTATVFHWIVHYIAPGQTSTVPNLYYQDQRSQIIKRGMEMVPANNSTVFKRIILVPIPKKMQRMVQTGAIRIDGIASSTNLLNWCGIAIYKEIY